MHGLINKALQRFACDTYGPALWARAMREGGLDFTDFEPMMRYDPGVTSAALDGLCAELGRDRAAVLEDVGTYLVSHPASAGTRRLLRFSGSEYEDFLNALDELPDRARLAVPDLVLPRLDMVQTAPDRFTLTCRGRIRHFGHVMVGVLRAMADDYGALVMLDHHDKGAGVEVIEIALVVASFARGRDFDLGARTG